MLCSCTVLTSSFIKKNQIHCKAVNKRIWLFLLQINELCFHFVKKWNFCHIFLFIWHRYSSSMTAFNFVSGFFYSNWYHFFRIAIQLCYLWRYNNCFLETNNFHFVHFVSAAADFQKETAVEIGNLEKFHTNFLFEHFVSNSWKKNMSSQVQAQA